MNIILLIAAMIVALLVFSALIRILKVSVTTALTVAIILVILQLIFGINPGKLWEEIINLPQTIWHIFHK